MVSIQKNLSVSSGIQQSSLFTSKKTGTKKTFSNHSVNTQIIEFKSLVGTDTLQSLSNQNALFHFNQLSQEDKSSLFYKDTPISKLSSDEAGALVSEDGYFGIAETSQRIIDFVIKGAGDDIERLKAGREGILRGFAEAEKAWGGKLPGLSYETLEKSLEFIDEKIRDNGGAVVDLSA
jgi:hypothetical protein